VVVASICSKVREFSKVVFYGFHLIHIGWRIKKARTVAIASIRACVVANRQLEPILRIQIRSHIGRLLDSLTSGGFPAKDDLILPSTGQLNNAVRFHEGSGKTFRGTGVRGQRSEGKMIDGPSE
jgi:hypothetical protein